MVIEDGNLRLPYSNNNIIRKFNMVSNYKMSNLFSLEDFVWQQEGVTLRIKEAEVGEDRVFHVIFSDQRKPLILTRMKSFNGPLWTSIPAGRKETPEIGKIIEAHFKGV